MDRMLASVQRVVGIKPIPDADKIETVQVLGWECIVRKDEKIKVGDLVIYVEIDSIVPDRPEYEFLRERKFRVRTIKLRGQLSQGLVLPLHYLKNYYDTLTAYDEAYEGMDVTNLLGIRKYDPQADLEARLAREAQERAKGKVNRYFMKFSWYRRLYNKLTGKDKFGFPSFIKKTDETRVQNLVKSYKDWTKYLFTVTEKLDGQSATYFLIRKKFLFWDTFTFGVCSRNVYLYKKDNSSYWKIAEKYNIKERMKYYFYMLEPTSNIVLQGEIVGPGIQENKYGLEELEFYTFNLVVDGKRIPDRGMRMLTGDLKCVPLIGYGIGLPQTISELLLLARGTSVLASVPREGLVIRNYSQDISFKAINNDFLLRYEGKEE